MPKVCITGSGTDIGKTYVAVQLIRHLRRSGRTVRVWKPVVTGFTTETIAASDCAALLEALGEPLTAQALDAMSPWRYRAPLGPATAAALEGRSIEFAAIAKFVAEQLHESTADFAIVEGLGGVMVPFDDERTLLDLLSVAAVPAVVVVGTYLGSLSHTLTTLDVLVARGIPIAAVVVNETAGSGVTLEQTSSALQPFVERAASALVALPRDPRPDEISTMCQAIVAALDS